MPKRVIDGDGLWRSDKLARVEPPPRRAEYAWLLPQAMANGVFEANSRRNWAMSYAYNRPDVTSEQVQQLLDEFERVGLLFRWGDEAGKQWGYWVGIDKPGRLPGKSRRGRNEAVGPDPPQGRLRKFLESNGIHEAPNGNNELLGFGSGFGFGSGSGSGTGSRDYPRNVQSIPAPQTDPTDDFDGSEWALKTIKAHPLWKEPDAVALPRNLLDLYLECIEEAVLIKGGRAKAAEDILERTIQYACEMEGQEKRFIPTIRRFFEERLYNTVARPLESVTEHEDNSEEAQQRAFEEADQRREKRNAQLERTRKTGTP